MKNLVDLLLLGIIRLLVALISALPEPAANSLSRLVVRASVAFMPRARSVADKNLQIAFPQSSAEKRREIYAASLDTLARNLFYFARMPAISKGKLASYFDKLQVDTVMKELYLNARGKGVLFLTAHFGVFELLAQVQSSYDRPSSILARDTGLRRLDAWIKTRREIHGCQMFGRKGGYQEIIRRLNGGENVTILIDQNVKRNHAAFIDFFGLKAATTKTMAYAAIRTGAPAVVCASMELTPGHLTVAFRNVSVDNSSDITSDERVERFLTEVNKGLESIISEHPEQWFWIHRRWKTRPEGEPETIYSTK